MLARMRRNRDEKTACNVMAASPLDSDAAIVLHRYPSFCRQGKLKPIGNYGGFSGAILWRMEGPAGPMCLRAWPDQETWQRGFDAKMVYDDPVTRAAFVDALADWAEEPLLLMEVTDDLLDRSA